MKVSFEKERIVKNKNTISFDIYKEHDSNDIIVAKATFVVSDTDVVSYSVKKADLKEINKMLKRYNEKPISIIKKSDAVKAVIADMANIKKEIYWKAKGE